MRSFDASWIARQFIGQSLLQTIRLLGEYKEKKEDLFRKQAPQVLEALRSIAIVQSTESSNRLEGITAPPGRIRDLVAGKTTPQNRSEQEIVGYRNVLNTLHANSAHMILTPGLILQLHRDLFQFDPSGGGHWKMANNRIEEIRSDGTRIVLFEPVPAHMTADAIERLIASFCRTREEGTVEPLLAIATFILDFLCIHPFRDGNGRMARLLSLLLLYQAGYGVGRFISLEQLVEQTKEGYYDTLHRSSKGWHQQKNDPSPWWNYFLSVVLLSSYRELENRVGVATQPRGAKAEMIEDCINCLPNLFRYGEIEAACPNVSRPTINRVLRELREAGKIRCLNPGRDATWGKLS